MKGPAARTLLVLAIAAGFAAIFVRLAWVSDDAYITLRSVENLASGNGLRWNAVDRVQTYTHPLWMLVLALGRVVSGEVYLTAIWLGIGLSLVSVVALMRRCGTVAAMCALAAMLASARAFCEYATSGLETSLTCLLLVAFVSSVGSEREPRRRFVRAVSCAALLATNRMDLALLCLPGVLATMRGIPLRKVVGLGFVGSLPFLAWLVFATIYYGSPLPVTAHAKAFGLGISAFDMAAQGLFYAWHTAVDDPALFATVVAGVCVGLRTPRRRLLALGALLYLGYVVKVGGDFMAGRFFLPPFVVAATVLAERLAQSTRRTCVLVVLAATACMVWAPPPWLRGPASDMQPGKAVEVMEAAHGIVDERRVYYDQLGLLTPARNQPGFERPRFGFLEQLVWPQGRSKRWFLLQGAVGVAGFGAGSSGHIVDPLLCDPLIARLPAFDPEHWRIGHVLRRIPEGYWETLAWGENRMHHPGLHRYVDALLTIVRAPVFAAERWSAIARMRFGEFDADLAAFVAEEYRKPPRVSVPAAQVAARLEPGTYWFDEPRLRLVYEGGVAVEFGTRVTARSLRVQVVGLCQFRFRFVSNGAEVGSADGVPVQDGVVPTSLAQNLSRFFGVREVEVAVPAGVEGFDAIWVDLFDLSDKAPGPAALGCVTLAK